MGIQIPKKGPSDAQKRREVKRCVYHIGRKAGLDLAEASMRVWDNLTADERDRLAAGGDQLFRLAKTILCACDERIMQQWAAEGILKEIRLVRKLRRDRYC